MARRRTPKYRHYRPKNLAMVVIDGHAHYLGKYDSPESRERYHRLIADLHAGRPPQLLRPAAPDTSGDLTVNELILAYVRFADGYYVKDGQPTVEPSSIRLVRRLYGSTPVASFGPLALKAVRQEMIRAGNCRTEINRRVGRIVRMFKWGVSEELVPAGVHDALQTVSGLRKGRSQARAIAMLETVRRLAPSVPVIPDGGGTPEALADLSMPEPGHSILSIASRTPEPARRVAAQAPPESPAPPRRRVR